MTDELEQEELQKLLRNAHVFLRRGDLDSAETNCRAAVDMDPRSAQAHELLGDVLLQRGDQQAAAESYHQAMTVAANPAVPETKYARVVLALSQSAQQEAALDTLTEAPPENAVRRSPVVAMLASMLWPGLGQWYNGENTKAIILASASGFVTLLLLITGQLQSLVSLFLMLLVPQRLQTPSHSQPGLLGMLMWGGAAAAWLYSVVDAPVRAGKARKTPASSYTEPEF